MRKISEKSSGHHGTYDETYTAYQTRRSSWRKWVRDHYLRAAASYAIGPSLDFGCGAGELLNHLPRGSLGIEYNQSTVEYCNRKGLDVLSYDGFKDDFSLSRVPWQGRASTLYLSHVLEHFDDPVHILTRLLTAVEHEAKRIVIIVPGKAGFKIDLTHRRYVDYPMIESAVKNMPDWIISSKKYFPLNNAIVGNFLTHNELHVILDKASTVTTHHPN